MQRKEVHVVKEKFDDADSDLFEPSNITESFVDRVNTSDSLGDFSDGARQFESQNLNEDSMPWISQPSPASIEEEPSVTPEMPTHELHSNTPQVSKVLSMSGEKSSSKKDPPQNLDPIGTKNAQKAPDSWIRSREDTKKDKEGEKRISPTKASDSWTKPKNDKDNASTSKATENKNNVGNQRFQSATKGTQFIEKCELNQVFIPTDDAAENDVVFHSTAMGIRLKRGEDGFVRVVSVTEANLGSSVVREGVIEPEDMVKEAAGVDLRSPITNSQWGNTVAKIRNAPRPMTFIIAGGPRRSKQKVAPKEYESSVIEFHPSKSSNREQVLKSFSSSSTHDQLPPGVPPPSALHHESSRATEADNSTDAGSADEEKANQPPKESFFKRIAGACVSPSPSQSSSEHHNDESQVPMAHLQFLRTNPTIARVTNAASRRYPAFCGRPDTIFEEPDFPDDDYRQTKPSSRKEETLRQLYGMKMPRSTASSSYGSTKGSRTSDGSETEMKSIYSGSKLTAGGSTANTAFLDKLSPAVAMQPATKRDKSATNMAISQKLGHSLHHEVSQGNHELGWPSSDEPNQEKDTIENGSVYSSTMSHASFKKDTARQAELLAATKVEDMMNDHNADPNDQCEI